MKPFVHAFTSLTVFERCPKQFAHKYVWKDLPKEQPSAAMEHGNNVHTALENRIKGKPLAQEYRQLERYALVFDGSPVKAEPKLGMTREGSWCDFWDTAVWFRGKVDVVVSLPPRGFITDWKTGKKYEDPDELEINALLLQAKYPELSIFKGRYVWLKTDEVGKEFDLSDTTSKGLSLKERTARVETAIAANFFPPVENPLCGWCPVTACAFNPKRGK